MNGERKPLRLHCIGPEVKSLDDGVWNFSGVYAHFMRRALLSAGVELSFSSQLTSPEDVELDGADHVLALGARYFDKVRTAADIFRSKFTGCVTQLADHDADFPLDVDVTFCLKRGHKRRHWTVGWAADPDLLRPSQAFGQPVILLDHPNYSDKGRDRTQMFLESAFTQKARVKILWSDGARILPGPVLPNDGFDRSRVPYRQHCADLAQAHVFVVTHEESLGQTALEAAMAGALVVCPRGFMAGDRLETIRHVIFDGAIPWRSVWNAVDPIRSHDIARRNSWPRLVRKVLDWYSA